MRARSLARRPVPVRFLASLILGGALIALTSGHALAQFRSEMRDPVRGVSFHSIEFSDDRLVDLLVIDGGFYETDRLALGLSAVQYDGSDEADRFIFWVRHQGRRWLEYDFDRPMQVVVDGDRLPLAALRPPQPYVGSDGNLYEKLEFELPAESVDRLLTGKNIMVQLRSADGAVDKAVSVEEQVRIQRFVASI